MRAKKLITFVLSVTLTAGLLVGCGLSTEDILEKYKS